MNRLKKYRRFLYPLLGAAGGFLYYFFIGCASGTCPITSNPYVSTLYGAGMGVLLGWVNKEESPR